MMAHPLWSLAHSSYALLFLKEDEGLVCSIEFGAPPRAPAHPPLSCAALNGTRSPSVNKGLLWKRG